MKVRRVLSWVDDALLVGVLAVGGVWGYQQLTDDDARLRPPPPASTPSPSDAERLLATLDVKGRAPKTGYDRQRFGVGAIDFDRNGCDHRNDTLRRDLDEFELRPGPHECVVERGSFVDPYTGDRVSFIRGANPSPIEIDHVVALADAWQKGAQQWPPATFARFANDPMNLLAVSHAANRAKGDGDAATWLPERRAFRCEYVSRQVAVKATYDLWVTAAERDAMARELGRCPDAANP